MSSGGDKYKNWGLTPGRLPIIANDKVEVDCYPGANLAYHIIKHKTPVSLGPQHVVLSFGLNNREQGNPTILSKSVEWLQGAAFQTFPNAVLHIPLINKTMPGRLVENIKMGFFRRPATAFPCCHGNRSGRKPIKFTGWRLQRKQCSSTGWGI